MNFSLRAPVSILQRLLIFLLFFSGIGLCADEAAAPKQEAKTVPAVRPPYIWRMTLPGGAEKTLGPEKDGKITADCTFPGGILVAKVADRFTFRPNRTAFEAEDLVFRVTATNRSPEQKMQGPVKIWVYGKDKDGLWFQTEQEFHIVPDGKMHEIRVCHATQRGYAFRPMGHAMIWNAGAASRFLETGLSLYSDENVAVNVTVEGPFWEGKKAVPKLGLVYWQLPEKTDKYAMTESRFELTRDYFNPNDPDEIEIDYEIRVPGNTFDQDYPYYELMALPAGMRRSIPFIRLIPEEKHDQEKPLRYPAFHTQNFTRTRHFTQEIMLPAGAPYWAFRTLFYETGKQQVRLRICDRSVNPEKPEILYTDWRTVEVLPARSHGPVRAVANGKQYFSFADGTFFFPIGLNIHSNTDTRAESGFNFGVLPDRGTYDYDEYFEACGKVGINMIEVWMSSWICGLEWNSDRTYFYGLGRYNMRNAWRLDHMLDFAAQHGIYLNVVLTPHCAMSNGSEQEWDDSPFNERTAAAVANGSFLKNGGDWWTSPEAVRLLRKRDRYVAARWGAYPNVYAFQLWSEVDLVTRGWDLYSKGYLEACQRKQAQYLQRIDCGHHLMTTHTCGDSGNTLRYQEMTIRPPEFTHIVSDAYRGNHIPFLGQIRKHQRELMGFGKPIQITEFGGTWNWGSGDSQMQADIHSSLWGSFFLGQSASSALWWHDFIHLCGAYPHFAGFSKFIQNIDLRKYDRTVYTTRTLLDRYFTEKDLASEAAWQDPQFLRGKVNPLKPGCPADLLYMKEPSLFTEWRLSEDRRHAIGWSYLPERMFRYELDVAAEPFWSRACVYCNIPLSAGKYRVEFFDPLTGVSLGVRELNLDGLPRYFPLPAFKQDCSFKITPAEDRSADTENKSETAAK